MDDEIQKATENLRNNVRILHISVKKMNHVAATMKAHFCKKNKELCLDIGILANGVVSRGGHNG